jgi:hypothetical protein
MTTLQVPLAVEQQWREPSFWEMMGLGAHQALHATKTAAKVAVWITKIIYWWTMKDVNAILKSLVTLIAAFVVAKVPFLADVQILGVTVEEAVSFVLVFLAGLVLPQLRNLTPAGLRKIMKWETTP